jgi:hypothetical protein
MVKSPRTQQKSIDLKIFCSFNKGMTKKERYKSTLNGVTVLSLANIKVDDKLAKNMPLFEYEKCTHPVISYDMCGVCGEDLKTQ